VDKLIEALAFIVVRGIANFRLFENNRLVGYVTLQVKVCHISFKIDNRVIAECILQSDFPLELDPMHKLEDLDIYSDEKSNDP